MTSQIDAQGEVLTEAAAAPLAKIRVLNLGRGLAPAWAARTLADLGAHLHWARSGSTLNTEEWEDECSFETALYPALPIWRRDWTEVLHSELEVLLGQTDVCILGGEPGLGDHEWSADALCKRHPRLIVLSLTSGLADVPPVDLLVEARTGAVFEQVAGVPFASGFPASSYGCALQGVLGILLALLERARSGAGQMVEASLAAGLAMFWGPFWMVAENPSPGFDNVTPKGARPLHLKTADDQIVQIVTGVAGALGGVHDALGMPAPANLSDSGFPDASRGAEKFFGDVERLNSFSRRMTASDLVEAMAARSVPAERILEAQGAWSDEQVQARHMVETRDDGWRQVRAAVAFTPASFAASAFTPAGEGGLLAGLKVVDFGRFVAGPYASKLLADYGADVTAVISPAGRPTLSGGRTIASAFLGKALVELDAKSQAARPVLEDLCRDADVVMNNFRTGAAERLGVDAASLRRTNPDLISLSTTAYGTTGPKAGAPGFDMTIQALCGLQRRIGGEGMEPVSSRAPMVDFAAGAMGAIGLLAALFERQNSGRMLDVDTSLLAVGLNMMAEIIQAPDGAFVAPPPGLPGLGRGAAERIYQTSDGWIAMAVRNRAMARAIGILLDLSLPENPLEWTAEHGDALARAVRGWSSRALLARLEEKEVWSSECVLNGWAEERFTGPVFRTMQDPLLGRVRHCIGPLIRFSRSQVTPPVELAIIPAGAV